MFTFRCRFVAIDTVVGACLKRLLLSHQFINYDRVTLFDSGACRHNTLEVVDQTKGSFRGHFDTLCGPEIGIADKSLIKLQANKNSSFTESNNYPRITNRRPLSLSLLVAGKGIQTDVDAMSAVTD